MKRRSQFAAIPVRARASRDGVASSRRSEESGFAFIMALGMMLIVLALSLVVLQNYVTDGKRIKEEETIWRGEQYARAIRLYYHKMGKYPQTLDDLEKGGLQLHFLRQAYKNPMNKTDGTWRFIYVNGTGQIIGSVRYATLQQMVLIDQYAGMLPGAPPTGPMPGQIGVSAASLVSGSGANSQQLQGVLAGILSSVPSNTDPANGGASSQPQSGTSQSGYSGQTSDQSNGQTNGQTDGQINGQTNGLTLPAGSPSASQIAQLAQSGQLPPGITPDMVTAYFQTGQLPPGITQDMVNQFTQGLQNPQSPGNSQNLQNPTLSGQSGFGQSPSGQPGSLSFGSSSSAQPGQLGAAVNPLLLMKPTGAVDGPVLGGFLTGVACTTDVKSLKVYRRGKKYMEWEFIWNPLEDAAASAQQSLGGQQGVLGLGQVSGTPGAPGNYPGGASTSPLGNSPMSPTSPGPQQPPNQQPPQPQ
ncbi:MAG TPA: hypothetical protein VN861_10335 [Candidatus Acidoferrales bacterium]|nr:hypothetical protein [Candidatus Acidoferrales bacterium]